MPLSRLRVGTFVVLILAASPSAYAQEQEDRPVVRTAASRATIGGFLDLRYAFIDGALEEFRGALSGTPLASDSVSFLSADVSLRVDADLDEHVRVALELAHVPYSEGETRSIGDDSVEVELGDAYLEIDGFLADTVRLRVGQFDFDYRLRPHGDPFFFDARAESMWSGADASTVRTTADRDLTRSAGLRVQWEPALIALLEFALVWREEPPGGASASDHDLMAILYGSSILSERTSLFLLASLAAGPGSDAEAWTFGAGVNTYFGPQREVELFVETYGQIGSIGPDVRKSAWAGQGGARLALPSGFWTEGSVAYRSGDRDPTDSRDQTFQSAEAVERFLIVENAQFGLDIDTNLLSLRAAAGYSFAQQLRGRLDVGWFAFNEEVVAGSDDALGIEVDAGLTYDVNASAQAGVTVAVLFGSDAMESLTADGDRTTWLVSLGANLRF